MSCSKLKQMLLPPDKKLRKPKLWLKLCSSKQPQPLKDQADKEEEEAEPESRS